MKRNELLIEPNGLRSCCLRTANLWIQEDPDAEAPEGEKITCRFETGTGVAPAQMVVHGGKLQWLDPDYPPLPSHLSDPHIQEDDG